MDRLTLSDSSAIHEAIYMWLDHTLQAETWNSSRRLLSPAYIHAICNEAPNHWTELLKGSLEKGSSNGRFSDIGLNLQEDRPRAATHNGSNGDIVADDLVVLEENGWHVS